MIVNSLVISYSSKSAATARELFFKHSELKPANNNLTEENYHQNKSANFKNNKSSSQQIVGTWSTRSVDDPDKKLTSTITYSPDGSFIYIVTLDNGDWYINTTATWKLTGSTLSYQNSESGKNSQGSVKFPSNNEFVYISDGEETKWQRVDVNPNLSKDQLLGTWSIVLQDRVGSSFIDNPFKRSDAKLIELNSDGTFRYKGIDAGIIGLSDIVTTKASGTWTYINSGYADGFLLLKDSQGNIFSFSSINWNEDGNFISINRSDYNRDQNKYDPGRIEEFRRSDLIIDKTF
ncbi:MAG: hypothetical protein ACFCAD_08335 [Pleurocapsa sp.]